MLLTVLSITGIPGCNNYDINSIGKIPRFKEQMSREEILSQKLIPVYTYEIVNTYPHNITSYTEGLLMDDGFLYDATGRYDKSKVMKVELSSGIALKQINLAPRYFGEGITIYRDNLYHLTYKSNTGFVYDKDTFDV